MATRIEGQLWLDKNNTHRLKYFIDGTTYEVLTSQTFTTDSPSVQKGQLLAMNNNIPSAAVWPNDAERVEGIVTSVVNDNNSYTISVATTGRLIFTADELTNCFINGAALPHASWSSNKVGVGCPVYWFIGKSESSSSYIDSSDEGKRGKLTFETPSGFKYKVTETRESFNVSYDNLPIVGHVVDYTVSGNNFSSLTIDLHFSNFEPVVTWNYPGIHTPGHTCGVLPNGESKFYHGLFADNTNNNICISELTARAIPKTDSYSADAEEFTIVIPYKNYIKDNNNRYTSVNISSMEELRYRITGTVHYNIDRS